MHLFHSRAVSSNSILAVQKVNHECINVWGPLVYNLENEIWKKLKDNSTVLGKSYQRGRAEWVLGVICQGYCLMSHCGREGERGHSRLTNPQYNNILAQSQIHQYVNNGTQTDGCPAPFWGRKAALFSNDEWSEKLFGDALGSGRMQILN